MTEKKEVKRRDFLSITAGTLGAVGAGAVAWPLIHQMNPDASVRALASTEVDLSKINEGQSITILWRGKPVFIRHRTSKEISEAQSVPLGELKDPELDEGRVQKPEWLIMVGVCTHLGCVPIGEKGEYGGWFCPCHGSHYDTAGRVRKGPAPKNLEVPKYVFLNETTVKIG